MATVVVVGLGVVVGVELPVVEALLGPEAVQEAVPRAVAQSSGAPDA